LTARTKSAHSSADVPHTDAWRRYRQPCAPDGADTTNLGGIDVRLAVPQLRACEPDSGPSRSRSDCRATVEQPSRICHLRLGLRAPAGRIQHGCHASGAGSSDPDVHARGQAAGGRAHPYCPLRPGVVSGRSCRQRGAAGEWVRACACHRPEPDPWPQPARGDLAPDLRQDAGGAAGRRRYLPSAAVAPDRGDRRFVDGHRQRHPDPRSGTCRRRRGPVAPRLLRRARRSFHGCGRPDPRE